MSDLKINKLQRQLDNSDQIIWNILAWYKKIWFWPGNAYGSIGVHGGVNRFSLHSTAQISRFSSLWKFEREFERFGRIRKSRKCEDSAHWTRRKEFDLVILCMTYLTSRFKKQGDLRSSLVLLRAPQLCDVAQWVSRAPPHHILPAFLNLNRYRRKWAKCAVYFRVGESYSSLWRVRNSRSK